MSLRNFSLMFITATSCISSTAALAAVMQARVVTDGNAGTAYVVAGEDTNVNVYLQVRLDNGGPPTSDGLAVVGMNLKASSTLGSPPDLCDTSAFLVLATPQFDSFDRRDLSGGFDNEGLTNPVSSANLSGFSGTCDGAGGLLQIGGAQNTVGNTPGGAPYPVGGVVGGAGNGAWTTVAEGAITVNLGSTEDVLLELDTVFGATIDAGQVLTNVPLDVSGLSEIVITDGLAIHASNLCIPQDPNCDGSVNTLDLAIVVNSLNYQQSPPACDRADVNDDGAVNVLDIAEIVNRVIYQVYFSPEPCTCVTDTPGVGSCPYP